MARNTNPNLRTSTLGYEVTNALYQMVRHTMINKHVAETALRAMTALPITIYEEDVFHQKALDAAVRLNIKSAYDAHYLALAEYLQCDLWTADKRLYNSTHRHMSWVRLVET